MLTIFRILPALLLLLVQYTFAQTLVVDKKGFFTDQQPFKMILSTDVRQLINGKMDKHYELNFQPATISCVFPGYDTLKASVEIRPRGDFRREECYMPPISIDFKTPGATTFRKLGRLKLVWPCDFSSAYEQLVLKEYLVYKIYNLLTEKSFRVRLVQVDCRDINDKIKPRPAFGFFIEDVDDLAKRNDGREVENIRVNTEQTCREQATLVSLFQYMVGNTDWSVPVFHNIKLIRSAVDTLSLVYMVPYDFDGCGVVNASYATPAPDLGIISVRQRLYRGFPRDMDELKAAIRIFQDNRSAIDSLVMHCEGLNKVNQKEMLRYIHSFYELVESDRDIKELFIRNARRD